MRTEAVSSAPELSGVPVPPPPVPPTCVPPLLNGSNVDSLKHPAATIVTSARNASSVRRIMPPRGNRRDSGKTAKNGSHGLDLPPLGRLLSRCTRKDEQNCGRKRILGRN